MTVRKTAMDQFSIDQLKTGEPISVLRDRLVPLYFLHRYQLEAVVKLIGGQEYDYAVKGGSSIGVSTVDATIQRKALETLSNSLEPNALKIPENIRQMMPPHAFGFGASRESFATQTGLTFDAFAAAHTLSDALISMVLHPQRAARLHQQKAFSNDQLGFDDTVSHLITNVFKNKKITYEDKALQEIVRGNLLNHLFQLGRQSEVPIAVMAEVHEQLYSLKSWLNQHKTMSFKHYYIHQIDQFFTQPSQITPLNSPKIPDGSPIGSSLSCM
jgi:hypothetical protein